MTEIPAWLEWFLVVVVWFNGIVMAANILLFMHNYPRYKLWQKLGVSVAILGSAIVVFTGGKPF